LLWLFWKWGLSNYLPGLVLNFDPPKLSLLSSWGCAHEPLAPGSSVPLHLAVPFVPFVPF
jgi:hypothetical protein